MWNVSTLHPHRIVEAIRLLPQRYGNEDFRDKAVTAPWGGKLAFVPRADSDKESIAMLERLDQRFAGARPQSEKDGWKAGGACCRPR